MQMDFSIGAVVAALIAGIFSFLGLVISKEQKISDFRQAWIDSLRSDIITYLTNINAITDALALTYKNHAEKVKALSPLYSNLNSATFSITLRLNPDEQHSVQLMECMNAFKMLAADDSKMTASNVRPIEISFIKASKRLLKYEWQRVKRGESVFIISKIIAAIFAALAFLALLAFLSLSFFPNRNTAPPHNSAMEVAAPTARGITDKMTNSPKMQSSSSVSSQ